jgi:hypothetical protein
LDSENPDNCAVSLTVFLKRQTHPRLMPLASKRKMTSKSGERFTLVYGEATMSKWYCSTANKMDYPSTAGKSYPDLDIQIQPAQID